MANVHGFGDNYNRRNNLPPVRRNNEPDGNDNDGGGVLGGLGQPIAAQQLKFADDHRILFVSGRKQVKNPLDQSYWDMLTFALCPTFRFLSVTFLITLADIAIFIFVCSVGLDTSSSFLLAIKTQTLVEYGGNYQPYVLNGQVYRLISAMFLHVYFLHIFGNIMATFMFASRIQYTFGSWKMLVIYIISGISGNIFSLLCSPAGVKAGASTALYGMIGVIIGYIVINWNGLDRIGPAMKCQVWCTAVLVIVFIFIFTPSSGNYSIDYYGHLGGFLAGVWLSAIHQPIISEQRQKIIRIVFGVLITAQLLICFLVFYLTKVPTYS